MTSTALTAKDTAPTTESSVQIGHPIAWMISTRFGYSPRFTTNQDGELDAAKRSHAVATPLYNQAALEAAEQRGFERAREKAKAAIRAKRLIAPRTQDGKKFNATITECISAITEIQKK